MVDFCEWFMIFCVAVLRPSRFNEVINGMDILNMEKAMFPVK